MGQDALRAPPSSASAAPPSTATSRASGDDRCLGSVEPARDATLRTSIGSERTVADCGRELATFAQAPARGSEATYQAFARPGT